MNEATMNERTDKLYPAQYETYPPAGLYLILDDDERMVARISVRDDGSIRSAFPDDSRGASLVAKLKAEPDGWEGTGYLHCNWPATCFVLGAASVMNGELIDPASVWVYHVAEDRQ